MKSMTQPEPHRVFLLNSVLSVSDNVSLWETSEDR